MRRPADLGEGGNERLTAGDLEIVDPSSGERLYRLALLLYPRAFRQAHAREMLSFYRELEREASRSGRGHRRRVLLDLLRSIPREHLRARRFARPSHGPRRPSMIASVMEDARFAVRTFARTPLFTLAALATIALGVGATATMFGVVDGVLLRALPYPGEGTLLQVGLRFGDVEAGSTSPADYREITARSRTLRAAAVSRMEWLDLAGDGTPERIDAAGVSHRFFDVLGVQPLLGSAFGPADDTRAADARVILSWGLWQRRFGGDPAVLGRVLTLNGTPWTVAGVMPQGFRGPHAIYQQDVELWFPLGRIGDSLEERGNAFLQMIARAQPGTGPAQVEAELLVLGERLGDEHPDVGARRFWVADLRDRTVGEAARILWILLAAVMLLLVISTANVANLFLVRATERTREMAVRAAIGAGRGRIARQLLTESVLLALAGGLLGGLLARAGVALFRVVAPAELPRLAEVTVDLRVLGFALAVSLVAGAAFGLAPVFASARRDLAASLRESGPGSAGSRSGHRLRGAFVIVQTAVAVVLLTGAALLLHAFVRVASVDPGMRIESVVWLDVDLPSRRFDMPARLMFFDDVLERVQALPRVRAAGAIHGTPLSPDRSITSVLPEGYVADAADRVPRVAFFSVLPGYFEAMGVRLIEGRAFDRSDDASGMPVAIVTQAFARRYWPDGSAVGRQIRRGESLMMTVVGVVADHRHAGLAEPPEPMLYLPLAQFPRTRVTLIAHHEGEAGAVLDAMRRAIWTMDGSLPLDAGGTMRARLHGSLVQPRFRMMLVVAFAGVALGLTCVGLYGTMAHLVRARRRELGIRLALGARGRDVRRMVVVRGMFLTGTGAAIGIATALATTRVLRGFLFDVSATDPPTFALGATFLVAFSLLACWIPARRAARLDPARTLRED